MTESEKTMWRDQAWAELRRCGDRLRCLADTGHLPLNLVPKCISEEERVAEETRLVRLMAIAVLTELMARDRELSDV